MSWVSGTRSSTHTDPYDVFLIGAQGRTLYKTEDEEAVLEKGDIIHIPKGVTHTAIGLDPRIVLSYALF
jgi:quercetin dioxygenase-like cupin family protein